MLLVQCVLRWVVGRVWRWLVLRCGGGEGVLLLLLLLLGVLLFRVDAGRVAFGGLVGAGWVGVLGIGSWRVG